LQTFIKDKSLKKFYGKPYEGKCGDLDRGCLLQAINQFSDIGGSDAAADDENLFSTQILRQSSATECNNDSVLEILVWIRKKI
jgi:hypothetical protein